MPLTGTEGMGQDGINVIDHRRIAPPFMALALAAGLAVAAACKGEANAPPPAPPAPQVGIVTVSLQSVPDEPEFIGQTESSRPVEIRSQVTGILKDRYFQEGRDVKKGDKLYKIDPVPFQAAVESAKARIAQQQARLVQAQQNLRRVQPLLAEQAVSQKDVDDAVAEDLAAKAALEAARSDLIRAKWELDNTLIVAPISGIIERTRFYEGRLISAQTDLLTIIHQVDPMYVIVSAPESFLLKRRQDLLAKRIEHPGIYQLKGIIKFSDGSVYEHEGVLDFADVGLRTQTGSRDARVVFPNPDRVLLPGQFVTVRFKGTVKNNVILVPQRAVQQGPKGPIVFIVGDGDKAEIRPVKAASWQGQEWLVEEGLKPGERVVVDGFHKLVPGNPVKAMPVSPDGAAPAAGPPPAADQTDVKAEAQGAPTAHGPGTGKPAASPSQPQPQPQPEPTRQ